MKNTMTLTHLRLKNWRNFTHVDVPLTQRMFIVGPNAIGKSNLLDAFRFLRDVALEGGGLNTAVRRRRGIPKLRSLHARGRTGSDVQIDVEIAEEGGASWRYLLAFGQGGKGIGSVPVVTREAVWRRDQCQLDWGAALFDRPEPADREDPKELTQTWLQQIGKNRGFRSLVDFFVGISYQHLVPQLMREEQRAPDDTLGADVYGRDLLLRMRQTPKKSLDARLVRIRDVLKIPVPNLISLSLVSDQQNAPHLEAGFAHWRAPAAKQDEREFSDGTLRLIGLLWTLQEREGPVLLEEPELSLHAALVRQLAPFIAKAQRLAGGRQAFISTHSEDLLSDEGIGPNEILLVRQAHEGSEVMLGAQIEEVRVALEAGISANRVVMPFTVPEQIDLFADAEV